MNEQDIKNKIEELIGKSMNTLDPTLREFYFGEIHFYKRQLED